ncbi:hypothetical protein SAMN05216358_3714 [Rhizobium sp. AN5]|uniref:peptidoglycan-binding domain-containing protein n=1 Tax=Rhizobium sp. AN5 TaxID=1855304 RepID=UPI000BC36D99|nr:hypothetical protein [Rhizobium sp. AN5]SOC93535.1 hypothetical protein SAMN05216358_3714 [Rhizobium sp. AN5]
MATVREVQQRLISLGYDVGHTGADGIPGTIGTKTLAALGLTEAQIDAMSAEAVMT